MSELLLIPVPGSTRDGAPVLRVVIVPKLDEATRVEAAGMADWPAVIAAAHFDVELEPGTVRLEGVAVHGQQQAGPGVVDAQPQAGELDRRRDDDADSRVLSRPWTRAPSSGCRSRRLAISPIGARGRASEAGRPPPAPPGNTTRQRRRWRPRPTAPRGWRSE